MIEAAKAVNAEPVIPPRSSVAKHQENTIRNYIKKLN